MKITIKMMIVLILALVVWSDDALAAKKVEVQLKGQAQPITGFLREISKTRYMLQGPDRFFEFDADDLISVNGKDSPSEKDLGQGRLVYTTRYEKILPNGDVEIWFNVDVNNTGTTLIESVDWGANERELEESRNQEVRDQFGNRLPTSVTPGKSGGYRVEIRLPVPVAPMEHVSLNVMRLVKNGAKRLDSGGWSYTFNVDFPEDRFFVRKVELPAGAEISAPNGWRMNEVNGRPFLHSHFYYPAHTVEPQVIEYRLP